MYSMSVHNSRLVKPQSKDEKTLISFQSREKFRNFPLLQGPSEILQMYQFWVKVFQLPATLLERPKVFSWGLFFDVIPQILENLTKNFKGLLKFFDFPQYQPYPTNISVSHAVSTTPVICIIPTILPTSNKTHPCYRIHSRRRWCRCPKTRYLDYGARSRK